MQSIFIEHAQHNANKIKEQIIQLNNIVLNYCISQIYTELISYLKYLEDISSMHIPNDRPVPTDGERHKQLEINHFY
jgi:hypothetical protein